MHSITEILDLVRRGALFVVNHSGGKDSQAMFHYVRQFVPDEQIVVVHAVLPDVEWAGTEEHVRATIFDHHLYTVRSRRTLLQMIEERGMFPSPQQRQCTSDLKRGPIEKFVRNILKARGLNLVVNCMGLRAEESVSRSKQVVFKYNERNSKAGREWYDWLPIHHILVGEVFEIIARVGQKAHWAYSVGMSRLSCCFCIMASEHDLTIAAQHNPAMYAEYVRLEQVTGQTMLMPKKVRGGASVRRTLEQVTGVKADMTLLAKAA